MPTPATPSGSGANRPLCTPSLESIVQGRLDDLAKKIPKTMSLESNAPRQETRLLSDIGEYLMLSAKVWAELSGELVKNRPIERAIIQAHENSRRQSRLADLTAVIALDREQHKLNQIRDLTLKFYDDVKKVWEEEGGSLKKSN